MKKMLYALVVLCKTLPTASGTAVTGLLLLLLLLLVVAVCVCQRGEK
jgi:hypothetical protein